MIDKETRTTAGNANSAPNSQGAVRGAGPGEGLSESLFEVLWQRRWTVLLTSVLALGAALIYLQRATPLYTSTSRVYVEQTGPKVFDRDEQGVMTRSINYLFTQAELLQSTAILSDVLKTLEAAQIRTLANVSNPMLALRRGLETTVGKKDDLISISFKSPYPDEAAQVVNTVVDAYVTFHDQRKRSTVAEVLRILKDEKTKRDQELVRKLRCMVEFRQKNEGLAFGTDQDSNVILRRLERLSEALTESELAVVESQTFYELAQQMANDPASLRQFVEAQRARGVYISVASEVASLRSDLNRIERDRADSLRELRPGHPAIAAVNAELERLKRQLLELDTEYAKSQVSVAEQQYTIAKKKEGELKKYFEEQRQQAILLNNQLAEYMILQSDYEQTKKLCDLLDDRIKELDVSTEVGALNISILETAEPAIEPSDPQKSRMLAMALGLGLFAGVGLALVREGKDQRLRSAEEISALLGLPVLGVIPSMASPRQTPAIRGQKVRISPDSREAEAFRTVRTAVFFGAPKDEARTILFTSPAPGEGKSTVAANLAIAMAQTGQKVLIIDADFRRPMQHKIFSLDRRIKGLSAVLSGQATLEQAIEHTGLEDLDVVTCGPDVPNPAEMLNSESFTRILETLTSRYDRVLIDSPPVMAVTDALILAARCDVTILILRARASMRKISMQAREGLASVDARVLGAVVNDASRKGGRYGYYSRYGYYYHYDSSKEGGRKEHRHSESSVAAKSMTQSHEVIAGAEGKLPDGAKRK